MSPHASLIVCSGMLLACLLLGGGTHAGFLADAILHLLAVPVVLLWCRQMTTVPLHPGARIAIGFCLAIVALHLAQLIPLPISIWTRLPGHEPILETMRLLGTTTAPMPLSVAPDATWISLLSTLPPLAVFLGVLQLGYMQRRTLTALVLGFALASAMLGLFQVAQGQTGAWRPFEVTNSSEAVGVFANRNHLAALLYCAVPLLAAWTVEAAAVARAGTRRPILESARILPLATCLVAFVVLVAAQTMARSRAGLGLSMLALLGGVAIAIADRRQSSSTSPARLIAAATLVAVLLAVQFALYRILDRFGVDPLDDARIRFAHTTIAAARAFMPFGAGMGTLVPVYGVFEPARDTLADTFANRAHNDILELWLEAGAAGLALMSVFIVWLAARSYRLWRHPLPAAGTLDRALARAASLIVALLVAHSLVDYPLRTTAMMAILALACGLLHAPLPGTTGDAGPPRWPDLQRPAQPDADAGNDIVWPPEWRQEWRQEAKPLPGSPSDRSSKS